MFPIDLLSNQLSSLRRIPLANAAYMPYALKHPRNINAIGTVIDQNLYLISLLQKMLQGILINILSNHVVIFNVITKLAKRTKTTVPLNYDVFIRHPNNRPNHYSIK